ncbi:hypothetical protein HXX76_009772 [Chlamydomonas incerta]|uniref:Uncharacterized protein n=1 Tax=Chlamydomonas incerta TaxID=51695 RepID=A0A835VZK6_CHLIN|nr:hypothetical protein HXX76_009772 [Chlamydomonas incerta]|eukprot:KAG2430796.1 hypothetical protein HXX76_009772 [Chlamydomonas incerta]
MAMLHEAALGWRPGQVSPLARTRRCRGLTVHLWNFGDAHNSLLAALLLSGVDAAVAASIQKLAVSSDCGLLTLCACASTLGGRLPNVRALLLAPGGDWQQAHATIPRLAYSALRAALPQLDTLALLSTPGLRGLEAFAGSGLTSVESPIRGADHGYGLLRRRCVRSLAQLTQLRHLELCLGRLQADPAAWQEDDGGDDGGGGGGGGGDAPPPAADEDDAATLAGLAPCYREQLLSLRLLLCTAPAALETLKIRVLQMQDLQVDGLHGWGGIRGLTFRFTPTAAAGRSAVAAVEVEEVEGAASLNFLAAALLPRLAATGQRRLPLLRLGCVKDDPRGFERMLSPPLVRPFLRLEAVCDRLELWTLELLYDPETAGPAPVADAVAAVRAVVQLCGWPSQQLCTAGEHPWALRLSRPGAGAGAANGGGGAATSSSSSAAASSPALSLATVPAEQLLRATAERLWAAATEVGAAGSEDVQAGHDDPEHRLLLLMQGPLVKQLASGGGGHAGLRAWLANVAAGLHDDGSSKAVAARVAGSAFVPTEALVLAQGGERGRRRVTRCCRSCGTLGGKRQTMDLGLTLTLTLVVTAAVAAAAHPQQERSGWERAQQWLLGGEGMRRQRRRMTPTSRHCNG